MKSNTPDIRNDQRAGPLPAGTRHACRGRAGLTLALVAATAACGANAAPVPGAATEMAVRSAYQCVPEAFPGQMSPEAIMDVPELTGSVRQLLATARQDTGEVLLTLSFDADGQNTRRDVIHHSVLPAVADSVQKLVFASMGRAPEVEREWGARLRIKAGQEVRMALEPREYCPPRPRNQRVETAMAEFVGSGIRYRSGQRERVVLLTVEVHPAGYVERAWVARGAPSGGSLERELNEYARQFSFYPASLDGYPVRGEVSVPVRLRG